VATKFVARFPRQRFVLDHLAKPPIKSSAVDSRERRIRESASFPWLFCKAPGLVTEAGPQASKPEDLRPYLDVAFESFRPSRLRFGSDRPVCTVAATYSRAMDIVKDYLGKYAAEERDAVLGGNAATL
jgi:L-fuconolactonase